MKSEVHIRKTKNRTVTLKITPHEDHIFVEVRSDKKQIEASAQEVQELEDWGTGILKKWDSDPRPLRTIRPISGEVATTYGDADSAFTVITRPNN